MFQTFRGQKFACRDFRASDCSAVLVLRVGACGASGLAAL